MATNPQNLSSAVSDASNKLGISLLKSLSKEPGNVFISPVSLSTALAMVQCGSSGKMRKEMRKVLGYNYAKLADDDVATAFSQLLSAWENIPKSYVLTCANSIVIDKKFPVKDEYKALLEESFKASLYEVNFSIRTDSEKAVKVINKWVSGKTNGKIPQILDALHPLTVIVLLNAIYFKGSWFHAFDEVSTRNGTFYNGGLKQNAKEVQMMHQTSVFGYAESKSFRVLRLPYESNRVSMMILLPRSLDGLDELDSQLTTKFLKIQDEKLKYREVKVMLPKFKLEYSKHMKDNFQSLGLNRMFEWGTDFDRMSDSDEDMMVFDICHKTMIEVNEKGSEATAVTACLLRGGSQCVIKKTIPDFFVDHPFLLFIYDEHDDAILFLGKIKEL